jgi:hypothetical protein
MKLWTRLTYAIQHTKKLFFTPVTFAKKAPKKQVHVNANVDNVHPVWKYVKQSFAFNLPDHYPLYKKLQLIKSQSSVGKFWDIFLVALSIIACVFYVSQTYVATYDAVQVYSVMETLYTQFFAADFIFNFFASPDYVQYLLSPWSFVDLITIIPVYITMGVGSSRRVNLSIFRFVRILRLVRILQTFKLLGGFSGVKRQIITLSLTLSSLVFMAAGIIQIMENDVKMQLEYSCKYINHYTDYEPSCSSSMPAYMLESCDCGSGNCEAYYTGNDARGKPSGIRCITLTFLDAFYFMVVTGTFIHFVLLLTSFDLAVDAVATVGYGDIYPTTVPSKIVVIVFIITSLVVIPMQVNKLTTLLSFNSMFRNPYNPSVHGSESHVIICGHVADWRRMERLFREFFHPARFSATAPEFHLLLLSPVEPSEDLKALLVSPTFDSKVSYIIGSALSMEDLQKARADIAAAMLFLCNTEVGSEAAKLDDAATVLRTLSVNNFNANLECFVQVLRREDREILKDSDIDVVICLDELKTTLQARNCICPGFSAVVENLFHSFGTVSVTPDYSETPWLEEYVHGSNFEVYYIPLSHTYLAAMAFEWSLVAEGIYLEFDTIALGVCCPSDHSIILNPSSLEISKYNYPSRFFAKYSVLIILANDQESANYVAAGIDDHQFINKIINKLLLAEDSFKVRKLPKPGTVIAKRLAMGSPHDLNLAMKEIIRISKSRSHVGGPNAKDSAEGKHEQDSGNDESEKEKDEYVGYVKPANFKSKLMGYGRKFSSAVHDGLEKFAHHSPNFEAVQEDDDDDDDTDDDEEDAEEEEGEDNMGSESDFGQELNMSHRKTRLTNGRRGGTKVDMEFQSNLHALMEEQYRNLDLGHASQELDNANSFKNHIVVFGCMTNLFVFVSELRRPLIASSSYHIILVISEETPDRWEDITEAFEDCYFIRGKITSSTDFNRTNIRDALAVVLLASRDSVTKVEEENLDSDTLFSYLKLEKYIPRNVFFTVELTCVSNMAVLNSTAVRRAKLGDLNQTSVMQASTKATAATSPAGTVGNKASPGSGVSIASTIHTADVAYTMRGAFSSQRKGDLHVQIVPTKRKYLRIRGLSKFFGAKKATKSRGVKDHKLQQLDKSKMIHVRKVGSRHGQQKQTAASKGMKNADVFWTVSDTHHSLPVFASGRAFVPLTFDSLIVQVGTFVFSCFQFVC